MVTTTLPAQRGPAAEDINDLWWLFLALGVAVYLLVLVLLVVPMLRRRLARRRNAGAISRAAA